MGTFSAGKTKTRSLLAVSALLVGLLAGCGGNDGSDDGAADEVSAKQQYVDGFNTIVAEAAEPSGSLDPPPNATPEENAEVTDEAADIIEGFAEELDELDPPEEIAELHDGYVDGLRAFVERMRHFGDLLRRGDPGALAAVEDPTQPLFDYLAPSPSEARDVLAFREAIEELDYDLDIGDLPIPGASA